ncbi:MAG TPA: hypothetical protein VEC57_07800 [Candidatus Limnocylindrales bacterium]|nr:hypothetical protein [Candidatus Limnocylindrales bacterium]
MKVSTMGAALAASVILGNVGAADAAFSPEELKCRATIAKVGLKLESTIDKALLACHKTRDTKVPSTDCSSIDAADTKQLVAKTEDALRASVGGAKDACLGLAPADVGFDSCPAPCDGTVPAINDFDDVAECLICSIRTETFASVDAVMGTPTVPMGGIEAKCHSTIGKVHGKLLNTVMKVRTKCQNLSDKAGGEDTAACAGTSDDVINVTRQKGEDAITVACQPVGELSDVDSCNDSSLSGLADCVMDEAETTGEMLYLYMYGEEPVGAFTWTEINSLFTTSCATPACHNAASNQGGLNLGGTPAANYGELVNAPEECGAPSYTLRVVPGNPATSFLMHVLDESSPECVDGQMPLLSSPLSQSTRDRIRAWIADGAPFN